MRTKAQTLFHALSAVTLLGTAACDKLVDSSNAAAQVTGHAYNDAANTWKEAFTYHPPIKPVKGQTRYCYKNMDDIVCYDNVQPTLTSRLVGYQDGDNISWVQSGGGSLGASGGTPVAYQQNDPYVNGSLRSPADTTIQVRTPIEANPGLTSYVKTGEIQSMSLPPH